ncbi:hypothetical protein ABZ905_34305 [Streptomyces parvus]
MGERCGGVHVAGRHPRLATGGHDGTVRIWNPATGTQEGPPLTGHTRGVLAVAVFTAPDGTPRLATSDYKTVRMDTGPLQAAEQSRADVMDRIRTHPRRKETLANLTAGRNAWEDLTGRRPPR